MAIKKSKPQNPLVGTALKSHFGSVALHELVTAIREFPATARLDLQTAITEISTGEFEPKKVLGTHERYSHETVTFSHLMDREGRCKLIQLYGGGLKINDELLPLLIQKTKGGNGAFIKELMRRSAQFLVEAGDQNLTVRHVESALDEMLFSGGSLNSKLLGFAHE